MRGCLWYPKRRNKTEAASHDFSSTKGVARHTKSSPNGSGRPHQNPIMSYKDSKDEVWFDSRLVFDSDSDDDFKSVSGDSLPASFGHAQSSPRPTFISLKERTENVVARDGSYGTFLLTPSKEPPIIEAKRTLGELFTHKFEEVTKPVVNGSKQSAPITGQGSKKGVSHNKSREKSCFPLQPRLRFMRCSY